MDISSVFPQHSTSFCTITIINLLLLLHCVSSVYVCSCPFFVSLICNNFKGLCNMNVAGQETSFQGDFQTEIPEGEER